MRASKFKERAKNSFFKREYKEALMNFSLALKEAPGDRESKIGAILSDMANENEEQAQALFEYYEFSKENENENAEDIIEDIIDSVDFSIDSITELLSESIEEKLVMENGIAYEDFIELIKIRGNFKRAFEDIMFSTRVMIHKKEDFVDFLEKLIQNGFIDISLSYLESASALFPNDLKIRELFKKINGPKGADK